MNFNINSELPNNYLTAFLIGFLSSYPSILPTAIKLKEKPSCDLYNVANIEDMLIKLPTFYGIIHIFLFFMINYFVFPEFRTYWFLGALVSFLYPTFAIITGHAQKVYDDVGILKFYVYSLVLYVIFYTFVINLLINNI